MEIVRLFGIKRFRISLNENPIYLLPVSLSFSYPSPTCASGEADVAAQTRIRLV